MPVAVRPLFLLVALSLAAAFALWATPPADAVVIGNGVVQLGINSNGELNDPGCDIDFDPCTDDTTSCDGTTPIGIRYVATNCDGISPGCQCEGWGTAYDDGTTVVTGYANIAQGTDIPCAGASTYTLTTPTRVIVETPICDLLVIHDYHPSPDTAYLFEATVTLRNTATYTMGDLLYRRVMDWDTEPTAFNEYVTIQGAATYAGPWPAPPGIYPAPLVQTWDNGFASADPTESPEAAISDALCRLPPAAPWVESIPNRAPLVDNGPCDHGALFDFNFGSLAPGQSFSFHIYYGAAGSEKDAMDALDAVDAQLWSLGQCSSDDCGDGDVNTFVFAFADIVPIPPPNDPPVADGKVTLRAACEDSRISFDAEGSFDPDGGPLTYHWDFGDFVPASATTKEADHLYKLAGLYTVTLTVTDDRGLTDTKTFEVDTVGDPNCCPTLEEVPHIFVMEYDVIGFDAKAHDFEGGPLTYTLLPLPPGADFNVFTGRFEWATVPGDAGIYRMTLFVEDPDCRAAQDVAIDVRPLPDDMPRTRDFDNDGVADEQDNCPSLTNLGQEDTDLDSLGDVCDPDPGRADDPVTVRSLRMGAARDRDRDGVADGADVCPSTPDRGQEDMDGDRVGDACDPDLDGDRIIDEGGPGVFADNCRRVPNADQRDADGDGAGDACSVDPLGGASRPAVAGDAPPGVLHAEGGGATAVKLFALAFAAAGLLGLLVVLAVVRRPQDEP